MGQIILGAPGVPKSLRTLPDASQTSLFGPQITILGPQITISGPQTSFSRKKKPRQEYPKAPKLLIWDPKWVAMAPFELRIDENGAKQIQEAFQSGPDPCGGQI